RLSQPPLLAQFPRFGDSPDPVRRGVREQVPGQRPVRLRAISLAAGLRQQRDAHAPVVGRREVHLEPGHEAEPLTAPDDRQDPAVVPDKPVFRPLLPEPEQIAPSRPGVLPGGGGVAGQPPQEGQLPPADRPQRKDIPPGAILPPYITPRQQHPPPARAPGPWYPDQRSADALRSCPPPA